MKLSNVLLAGLIGVSATTPAFAKVTATQAARVFRLDGDGMTCALGVDDKGYLQPLYWGQPSRRVIRWVRPTR